MKQLSVLFSEFSRQQTQISRPLKAVIKLEAFQENIRTIADSAPESRVLVVIKADAYGHGAIELARAAGESGELAVSIPEELRQLRNAGIQNSIWVLEGPFSIACLRDSENVVWVLHSLWQLELLRQALDAKMVSSLSVCIKLDTGMHRLGFSAAELAEVFDFLARHKGITLTCAMTHFAMSDEPENESVMQQISRFDQMLTPYTDVVNRHSMANSGGILFYPQTHRDWIRPGIMLYGGKPSPDCVCALKLRAVMQFQSAIIALHHVKKDEYVGYGSTWKAERDSLIATVAAGYADGYPRHAKNGTPVAHINPQNGTVSIVPLAGRVSMDMITIDVTDIENVQVGDTIELWGELLAADEVAKSAGTIAYDLFTGVSKRVPRVYM